jgi:hypothetical protein
MSPYSLVESWWHFGGIYCSHFLAVEKHLHQEQANIGFDDLLVAAAIMFCDPAKGIDVSGEHDD